MADIYNISIDQGATFSLVVTYTDPAGDAVNLTGYTAALQARETVTSSTAALSFTESAGIAITAVTGVLTITATAAQTTALSLSNYVYDLEITSGAGVVTRLLQGAVAVSPQVTR